jgi:hypothetical protein
MNDGIFRSVGQALHVSFLMAILPPTQRVSTQVLIQGLREQLGKEEARAASTINLGGMSPLEFRGQCAMVISSARTNLPAPEYAAVLARFGHQRTKAEGVAALADYVQPLTRIDHALAVRAVVWNQYYRGGQRADDRWSIKAISEQTGVPKSALRRCVDVVRTTGTALEKRADERLAPIFEARGVTQSEAFA